MTSRSEGTRAKAPAYQWYPGDFRRDTAVQSCSFEARALWREMLDLMHDGEPYGHLTAGGIPIDVQQLARMVGVPGPKVAKWLRELEQRKVFSRTEGNVIFSRRMVRDEDLRTKRRAAGHLGGNPTLVNQKDKPRDKAAVNGNGNHGAKHRGKQKPTPASAVAVASASSGQKQDQELSPSLRSGGPEPVATEPGGPLTASPAVAPPPPEEAAAPNSWPARISVWLEGRGIAAKPGKVGAMLKPAIDRFGEDKVTRALATFFDNGVAVHGQKPQFVTLEQFVKNPGYWVQQITPINELPKSERDRALREAAGVAS